jgi:hypothetical protein
MKRVIAYIDGFNLYYGLRSKGWTRFYWLNLQKVAQHLLIPNQTLVVTKYFTAKVRFPPGKQRRQTTFLEALGTLPDLRIYYGHYLADKITCRNCGHTYTTHHEKMTDVNIAVELLTDAFPHKRVIVVFPPKRHSNALKNASHVCLHLDRVVLAKSVFPNEVVKADGFVLRRPSKWR